ncbi:MAG TPA: tyrosine-type recombinase/integrase [Pyrinomonadaceae bacterium]|jgi:integrase
MPRKKAPTRFKYTTRRAGVLYVVYPLPGLKYPVWRTCREETQEAVDALIAQIEYEYRRALDASEIPDRAGAFLEFWLELIKPRVAAKTWLGYRDRAQLHLKPALSDLRLDELKPIHFQNLYKKMLAEGFAAQTVRHVHSVAKNCFSEAVELELIQKSPVQSVKPPKVIKSDEIKTMSPDEARRFLAACRQSPHGIIFEFALETGMRPEEYLALEWSAINFKARTVEVRRAVVEDENRRAAFAPVKTKHSRRTIKLSAQLAARLAEHRENQRLYIKDIEDKLKRRAKPSREHRKVTHRRALENFAAFDLVFPSAAGTPVRSFNLNRRYFAPVLKAAGVAGHFTPYSLRHTCCSLMALSGVHVKTASAKLGHSNISVTLNIYTHVLPEMQNEAVDLLANILYE